MQTVEERNNCDEHASLFFYRVHDPGWDFWLFGWRSIYGLAENFVGGRTLTGTRDLGAGRL
jgi:hypothetical protein